MGSQPQLQPHESLKGSLRLRSDPHNNSCYLDTVQVLEHDSCAVVTVLSSCSAYEYSYSRRITLHSCRSGSNPAGLALNANAPDRHPLQPEMEDEQLRLDHDGFFIVSQPTSRKRCVVVIPKREF